MSGAMADPAEVCLHVCPLLLPKLVYWSLLKHDGRFDPNVVAVKFAFFSFQEMNPIFIMWRKVLAHLSHGLRKKK